MSACYLNTVCHDSNEFPRYVVSFTFIDAAKCRPILNQYILYSQTSFRQPNVSKNQYIVILNVDFYNERTCTEQSPAFYGHLLCPLSGC